MGIDRKKCLLQLLDKETLEQYDLLINAEISNFKNV
jgi:hypothetical protein